MNTFARKLVAVITQLQREPSSALELARHADIHVDTAREVLRGLHASKAAHIAEWELIANGRSKVAIYALGPGTDAPRPRRTPNHIVKQRYRERIKARAAFDPFFAICRPPQ